MVFGQRAIGEHEALVVELQRAAEPGRRGVGADEAEEARRTRRCGVRGGRVFERHGVEVVVARELAHLGRHEQRDPRVGFDALDEVVRHAVREVGAADRDRHGAALLREVDRGLARGVAATDHEHRMAAARAHFEIGRRVVHAGALEPLEIVDREPLVARTRRDDDGAARDLAAVHELDDVESLFDAQATDLARRVQARTQSLGLDGGARRELLARDAAREADVVLDAGARAGLAAGGGAVERERVESFRRAVHGRGQTRRPAADDDQVEHVPRHRTERQTEMIRELTRRRVAEHAGAADHDGCVRTAEPHVGEHDLDVVLVLDVDPRVREGGPGGVGAQRHRVG